MTVLYYQLLKECKLHKKSSLVEVAPILHFPIARAMLVGTVRIPPRGGEASINSYACVVETGRSPLRVSLSPEEIVRRLEALQHGHRRCRECPANRFPIALAGEKAIGCIGTVELPITAAMELAFLQVIDNLLENSAEIEPAVTLPIRYIWDNGLEGTEIADLRHRRDLFELAEPVEARVGPFLEKQLLNTDQLLSLFLLPGIHAGPNLHLFAPFAADFVTRALSLATLPEPTPLQQLIPFFDSLALASELNVGVELVYLSELSEIGREEPGSRHALAAVANDPMS